MSQTEPDLIPLNNSRDFDNESKRAKRADAVANRQLLLQTAEQLFEAQGIEQVKMMAIAEAAGVGQGTLYRAFANKGELCVALMDEDLRQFQEQTLGLFRRMSGEPVLTQLEAFLDKAIRFLDVHATLMCEVQGYELTGDEINHTGLHTWFHQTVGLLLRKAQSNNEIRSDLDLAYATDAILAPLNPSLFTHQRRVLGFSVEQISRELRQLVLEGIISRPDIKP
ncbi:MAG: TetR/AcrR family transcriptional regulator [Anaerolineae bacterium]|nr:TetR/AcrR family transcriptional regulator [Anaerolineae bacterium]